MSTRRPSPGSHERAGDPATRHVPVVSIPLAGTILLVGTIVLVGTIPVVPAVSILLVGAGNPPV